MSLRRRPGVSPKNTITAQLMQSVGPAGGSQAGPRHGRAPRAVPTPSVPSLALGTSPVTLKEMMVSAYRAPSPSRALTWSWRWSPASGTARGEVLEAFRPASPRAGAARRHGADAAGCQVRRDRPGHGGTSIRTRFGIRADVAGQDRHHAGQRRRLVHPDASATGGRRLGRVQRQPGDAAQRLLGAGRAQRAADGGDFFQRSLRARVIDPNVRFVKHEETGLLPGGAGLDHTRLVPALLRDGLRSA
ncbi:hypothetical protein ACU4GD_11830 [Cupriavidus basilensis]